MMSDTLLSDDDRLYTDVSDGEFVDAEDAETYASIAASGTRADGSEQADENLDADGNEKDTDEEINATIERRRLGQHRFLSDFEREHFHPLNVTPDRPCTAFFNASSQLTSKEIFDSLARDGIAASAVRCLQRKPNGNVMITFTNPEHCLRFLDRSSFIIRRSKFTTHPASGRLTYLTVYDAPYELPDPAIEHRLKPYCTVYTTRRGKLQGYPNVYNGMRHYRVELKSSVPCYLRFGKFQLRFYHDGQQKTCRRCGSLDHIARDCSNEICFNCDEIGHTARHCPEEMLCCICKGLGHKAIDCRLSWFRRPITHREESPQHNGDENDDDGANMECGVTERASPAHPELPSEEQGPPVAADHEPCRGTPVADVDPPVPCAPADPTIDAVSPVPVCAEEPAPPSDTASATSVSPQPTVVAVLTSQGFIADVSPNEISSPRPRPAIVPSHSSAAVSASVEESGSDAPTTTATPTKSLPQRQKPTRPVNRRQPAKINVSAPLSRKPTQPSLVTSHKQSSKSSSSEPSTESMDTSGATRKRKSVANDDSPPPGKNAPT